MASTVIKLKNISKRFKNISALKNVSLEVQRGDLFGYLGPNGAGKTTTIRVLLGLLKPDNGSYEIMNGDGNPLSKEKIGFVLEGEGLFEKLTAYQNLYFFGKIYNLKNLKEKIVKVLEMVSLKDNTQSVGTFSKGMKKRLALARALLHEPELLILDEPTAGLDPLGQMEIQNILYRLSKEKNVTVFLTSHNLDEVKKICNSFAILYNGELKFKARMEEIKKLGKSLEELYCQFVKDGL